MDKPLYRVATAGLDPRDARLIEIVFRHSQYNRHAFCLAAADRLDDADILVISTSETEGLRTFARVRSLGLDIPIVAAVPSGTSSSARYSISIDRLTLQLLPILNRVVEFELANPDTRPMPQESLAARTAPAVATAGSSASPTRQPERGQQPAAAPRAAARVQPGAPLVAQNPASVPVAPTAQTAQHSARAATGRPSGGRTVASVPAAVSPAHNAGTVSRDTVRLPTGSVGTADAASGPARESVAPAVRSAPAPGTTTASTGGASRRAVPSPDNRGVAGAQPVPPPRAGPARVRVLVVDDSPTVRQQLGLALGRMGAACDAVSGAAAGLERMTRARYDLVLVDVVMPDIDGYRLTREIRRKHRGVPVIILTSRSSPFDLVRGTLAGCASYLVKPVTLRALEAAVVKVLRKTLAIDDLSGLLKPISLYPPRSGRP